jgi:RNA polymerase sigma-70 factor (ECF subfamily)
MRARRLDRWFDRFRRRGDVGALARVFDGTAPELYRVAVHLARDLHAAEDLVQATFLAAIESRDAYDARRELLPWLLGILARKAAEERRRAARAIEPDRLEARKAEDPTRGIESVELSAGVQRALAELPPLYRDVLELHLLAGKTPQEIALALGRAPGTVRVQLHRGLDLLRRALPAGLAIGGAIALAPRGLDAVRRSIVSAGAGAAATIPSGTLAVGLTGGIVMGTKAWIGAGAVVIGLSWIGWRAVERWPSRVAVDGPADVVATRAAEAPTPIPPVPLVESKLAPDEAPAPDRTPAARAVRAEKDATVLPSGCSVSGELDLPDGSPAAAARVVLLKMIEGAPRDLVVEGSSGSDGHFLLKADPGAYLVVGLVDGLLPWGREVTLLPSIESRLDPAAFARGAHVRGQVLINGLPAAAGCEVSCTTPIEGTSLRIDDHALVWAQRKLLVVASSTQSDAEGRFAIEGIEARVQRVVVNQVPVGRILHADRDVLAPVEGLVLDFDCARVVVRTEAEGLPLASHILLTERGAEGGSTWGFGSTATAEALVPPGTAFAVRASQEGFVDASLEIVAPAAGETLERVVELDRAGASAELEVELRTPAGEAIDSAGFGLLREGATDEVRAMPGGSILSRRKADVVRDETGAGNRFRLRDLPPGRYELIVNAGGTWDGGTGYWHHDRVEVELSPGGMAEVAVDLRLGGRARVQCANRRGAWLGARCQVFDAEGREIKPAFIARGRHGVWTGHGSLNAGSPGGWSEMYPNLAPGSYEIRFSEKGYRTESRTVAIAAGKTVDVAVVLDDA